MTGKYTQVISREQVTDEVLEAAIEVYIGWFQDQQKIDWSDFIDRLDGVTLDDGTTLDLGESLTSPAVTAIKEHVRRYRKESQ